MAFSTRYIDEYRAEIRLDIGCPGGGSLLWEDTELDRCIQRAVEDLSRHSPLEVVYEHTIVQTVTSEAWTSAAAAGTYVTLGYKPIEPGSESVVDSGSTACTRDTDYTIDYINGTITHISGGEIGNAEACTISYKKDRLGIDISAIITNLIRINAVIYPSDQVPQQRVAYDIWNDFMYVGSQQTGESQTYLNDKEHVTIYYEMPHTAPLAAAAPSYQAIMDQIICTGAGAYALLLKAINTEHQVVVELASMRTELTTTTAIHTLTDTALDKVTTYVADMDTALNAAFAQAALAATALVKINSDSGRTYLTDADGALDSAATALAKVLLYLETNEVSDGGVDNAVQILGNITDDVAEMRTAMKAAVDAVATALGKVSTVDLDAATVGAVAWLLEGELLINTVNVGDRVPENFREYASTKIAIAQARAGSAMGYINEAAQRLDNVRTHIEESGAWVTIANSFMAEAMQRINEANSRTAIADRYIAEARERTSSCNSYVNEAMGRFNMCQAFVNEAATRISEIDRHLEEANQYNAVANTGLILADRFREEGRIRMREFQDTLANRAEYRKRIASVPTKQPASAGTSRVRTDRLRG